MQIRSGTFNDIYKMAHYDTVDYEVIDRVNKFGDAYEVVYFDEGMIKSKVLDSSCCILCTMIAVIILLLSSIGLMHIRTSVTITYIIQSTWIIGAMKVEICILSQLIQALDFRYITIISRMRIIILCESAYRY